MKVKKNFFLFYFLDFLFKYIFFLSILIIAILFTYTYLKNQLISKLTLDFSRGYIAKVSQNPFEENFLFNKSKIEDRFNSRFYYDEFIKLELSKKNNCRILNHKFSAGPGSTVTFEIISSKQNIKICETIFIEFIQDLKKKLFSKLNQDLDYFFEKNETSENYYRFLMLKNRMEDFMQVLARNDFKKFYNDYNIYLLIFLIAMMIKILEQVIKIEKKK
jgi:hypothetical protein